MNDGTAADQTRWMRVRRLFEEALQHAAGERDSWLEARVVEDPEVLAEVRSLLARADSTCHGAADSVVDGANRHGGDADDGPAHPLPQGLPQRIGAYTILSVLGEGGMGWVLEARQQNPERRVALKVIKSSFASEELRRRFELEGQLLGRLRHPAIAQVHEAGTATVGAGLPLPYFAMELVEDARPITDYARHHRLDQDQRLELFCDVADGIEHGHQRGVVHRDIKPGNILVDGTGRPRIIDFGLALVVGEDADALSMHTRTGQVMGTPQYMSPEQFAGDPARVNLLADVYSLGVLLYELVSDELPYDLRGKSMVEMAATVQHESPKRLAGSHHGSRGRVSSRADLATIIGKAMDKNPSRRYVSAAALAADLRRFQRREPIEARPASALYQLRLFARRHRVLAGSALAVLLVSTVATAVSLRYAILADRRADDLLARTYALEISAAARALDRGDQMAVADHLVALPTDESGWEWRHLASRLQLERSIQTRAAPADGTADSIRGQSILSVTSAGSLIATTTISGLVQLWSTTDGALLREFDSSVSAGALRSVVSLNSEGSLFSVALKGPGLPMSAWIGNATNGEALARITSDAIPRSHSLNGAALSPDGQLFAWITPAKLAVFELHAGGARQIAARGVAPIDDPGLQPPAGGRSPISEDGPLVWLPDSSAFLVQEGVPGRDLVELSARDLSERRRWSPGLPPLSHMALSRDGSTLALATADRGAALLNLDEPNSQPRFLETAAPQNGLLDVAIDFDGGRLLTVSISGKVTLWDTREGAVLGTLRRHGDSGVAACFADHDELIVSTGTDGSVRTYDVGFFHRPHVLQGHGSFVYSAVPTRSGARLVSGGWDGWSGRSGGATPGSLRIWDMASGEPIAMNREAAHWVSRILTFPDSDDLLVSMAHERERPGADGVRLLLIDGDSGRALTRRDLFELPDMALSPDGRRLAVSQLNVWQPPGPDHPGGLIRAPCTWILDPRSLQTVSVISGAGHLAWHPDSQRLALAQGGQVTLRDVFTDKPLWTTLADEREQIGNGNLRSIAFDPEGRRLLVGLNNGTIQVLDAASGEPLAQIGGARGSVWSLAFSPDGSRLFSGDGGGGLNVIDPSRWEPITTLRGHDDYIFQLSVSRDGRQVISASGDGTVRLWDDVPDPVMLAARREHRRLVSELEPMVRSLFDQHGQDPTATAAQLRADSALDSRQREVALQVLLGLSMASDPDPAGELLAH